MIALVLAASLLLAGPSLVAALTGQGDVDTAFVHLVLSLVVCAIAGHVLRSIVRSYEASVAAAAATEAAEVAAEERAEAAGRRRADL